jgi:hypothetical protein
LYVMSEDIAAFEEKLRQENDQKVSRKQIELIFNKLNSEQWRGKFNREGENGLDKARVGGKGDPTYLLSEVSEWLKFKGDYTPAEIIAAINKYNGVVQETAIAPKAKTPNNCTVANLAFRQLKK